MEILLRINLAVDDQIAVLDLHRVAGRADHALDKIGIAAVGIMADHHVKELRIAAQGVFPLGYEHELTVLERGIHGAAVHADKLENEGAHHQGNNDCRCQRNNPFDQLLLGRLLGLFLLSLGGSAFADRLEVLGFRHGIYLAFAK